jgi:serine/threonine protein kinase/tetratricopeptide (TPR) repeat protein
MIRQDGDAKSIFCEAIELPPADRPDYLGVVCGGNPALRAKVEALLAAHDRDDRFLGGAGGEFGPTVVAPGGRPIPTDDSATRTRHDGRSFTSLPGEAPGTVVDDRYKLIEPIGSGGMGTVWLAHQTVPVRRSVAVKLIKHGMDTRTILARFEAERQALALMDHPNIAKVLDAGATADGRPCFVMELVKGAPITRFCDDRHLTLRERLELFVPVCQAIQHAHQKGIIHRDVKPSNVLVAEYDGRAVPKVIDFGVAKASGEPLTDYTLHTGLGLVGTPEYMAPEQAESNQPDVDTRADVYALGVILYELLTGVPPFSRRDGSGGVLLDVLKAVREQEPARPSTRLSTAAGQPGGDRCGLDPEKLAREIRGELDWIVMRALEKDRNRRYETANGLAKDVERYLAGEPVQAVPPSLGYRVRKIVRRNRGVVAVAAALALALMVGLGGVIAGLVRAKTALTETDMALQGARAARAEAETERDTANTARRVAETALQRADAAQQAEGRQRTQTEEEKKRADEEKETAQAAIDFIRDDIFGQKTFGAEPTLTVRAVLDRAARRVGDKFRTRPLVEAAVRQTIGEGYLAVYAPHDAMTHLRRSAELFEQYPRRGQSDQLATWRSLAVASFQMSQFVPPVEAARARAEGIKLFQTVLAAHEAAHPGDPDHPDVVQAQADLGNFYNSVIGGRAENHRLLALVWKSRQRTHGEGHPVAVRAGFDLAFADADTRRIGDLIPALESLLSLTPDDPLFDFVDSRRLADAYRLTGKTADAVRMCKRHQELCRQLYGLNAFTTANAMQKLATLYYDTRQYEAAVVEMESFVRIYQTIQGPNHPVTLIYVRDLACTYNNAGRHDDAVRVLEEHLPAARLAYGHNHHAFLKLLAILGEFYDAAGRPADALAARDELMAHLLEPAPGDGPNRDEVLARIHLPASGSGEPDGAEKALRRWLATRREADPNHWTTASSEVLLGAMLVKRGKWGEAEQPLKDGYRRLETLQGELPPAAQVRLAQAADWLVELYTAWGKPGQADEWRRVRAKYPPPQAPHPRPVRT